MSGFASTQTHTLHHTQLTLLISSSELSSLVRARIWRPLVPYNLEQGLSTGDLEAEWMLDEGGIEISVDV